MINEMSLPASPPKREMSSSTTLMQGSSGEATLKMSSSGPSYSCVQDDRRLSYKLGSSPLRGRRTETPGLGLMEEGEGAGRRR